MGSGDVRVEMIEAEADGRDDIDETEGSDETDAALVAEERSLHVGATLAERTEATARSRIRRHAERRVPEQVEAILQAGRVAHIAYAIDGQPYVLPFTYDYADERIYVHAVPGSRTVKTLRAGMAVAVEITMLDGLIASRDASTHSMNYRSVVVFGHAEAIRDHAEKRAIFERMTARYFPNRTAGRDYAHATVKDLRGVEMLMIPIEEVSAKSRVGGPRGEHDDDEATPGSTFSAFVVPLPGLDS